MATSTIESTAGSELFATLSVKKGLLIDGKWIASANRAEFPVFDPATGGIVAHVADAGAPEATAAVDAAAAALPLWRATPPRRRSEILHKAFELTIESRERLAALIALENGKALSDARSEVTYAAEFFRWFAEETVRTEGGYGESPAGGTRTIVTHKPVGVCVLVTPWNFPAAMATRKIAPALAAGCTVVLKPAGETPLTALAIAEILQLAGVPAGVVNVVPTTNSRAVVTCLLEDDRVRKLSFTGSTEIGRVLLKQAADRVINTSMELGGNAPFVVTARADIDAAVAGAMAAKFRNGGQACTAANRFFVHADVVDEFSEKFAAAVAALRVGPGLDESTEVGPLVTAAAVAKIVEWVEAAVLDGATIGSQGAVPAEGFYYPPTVLRGVPADAAILATEIFGPVAPIVTWTDEQEMLRWVNSTEFGLAAYVFSEDLREAIRLGEGIDAGMVGINRGIVSDPSAPFGGLKQSGIGREGAREGLRAFQETQYLSVDWTN